MANVVTKVGDVINVVYSSGRFAEYSHNVVNDTNIALLENDDAVETNILCNDIMQYTHSQFDTVGGVNITSNQILFDELEKML